MKKTYLLLCVLFVASVSLVVALYQISFRINHADNGFIRLFPPHPVLPENVLDLPSNAYYVAGTTPTRLYLGNMIRPLELLTTPISLRDTQRVAITVENLKAIQFQRIQLKIDSPHFYILDGIRPAILKGIVNTWRAQRYMPDSAYFTEAIPLSPTSVAIRIFSRLTHTYVLGKETIQPPYLQLEPGILTKQVDGLFCMDGMLHYNRETNQLVYLYYYRNQFICMDSSLNVLYRGKTIDTISHAQIKVAALRSESSITLAAPPLTVNNRSCVSGNHLFVHSNLLASNERRETFEQASVIDVYDLRDGAYRFSFYLFNPEKQKLHDITVTGDRLIAMFGKHLYTYKLAGKYFSPSK